jgi:triosephosphate isomerase
VVEHVKVVLRDMGASEPAVIYGGTVAEQNIDDFVGLDGLDGVGATRASLEAQGFLNLVDRVARRPGA